MLRKSSLRCWGPRSNPDFLHASPVCSSLSGPPRTLGSWFLQGLFTWLLERFSGIAQMPHSGSSRNPPQPHPPPPSPFSWPFGAQQSDHKLSAHALCDFIPEVASRARGAGNTQLFRWAWGFGGCSYHGLGQSLSCSEPGNGPPPGAWSSVVGVVEEMGVVVSGRGQWAGRGSAPLSLKSLHLQNLTQDSLHVLIHLTLG